MVAVLEQFSFSLGSYTRKHIFPVHIIINGKGFFKYESYTCKRIFPIHIITNILHMTNNLLHVLYPYKLSN